MHRFPLAAPDVGMGCDGKFLHWIICIYYSNCKETQYVAR